MINFVRFISIIFASAWSCQSHYFFGFYPTECMGQMASNLACWRILTTLGTIGIVNRFCKFWYCWHDLFWWIVKFSIFVYSSDTASKEGPWFCFIFGVISSWKGAKFRVSLHSLENTRVERPQMLLESFTIWCIFINNRLTILSESIEKCVELNCVNDIFSN